MADDELRHWGIPDMKWGIRRFQNKDGSLTPEGRIRYGKNSGKTGQRETSKNARSKKNSNGSDLTNEDMKKQASEYAEKARYYRELNNYMYEKQRYDEAINPPKKTNKFVEKLLVEPATKTVAKFMEFQGHSLIYVFLGGGSSDAKRKANADMYLNWVISSAKSRDKSVI